jgi:hypothetical protein
VKAGSALIWTIRDGLVRSVEVFSDQREALAAAGLPAWAGRSRGASNLPLAAAARRL